MTQTRDEVAAHFLRHILEMLREMKDPNPDYERNVGLRPPKLDDVLSYTELALREFQQ
jgi:hypothetical protein